MTSDDLDLDYLRSRPENLERLLEHQRIRTTPLPGGDICVAERLTLDDGTDLFSKSLADPPPGFFAAEAVGLRWIAESRTVPVPEIIWVGPARLVLSWIAPGPATADGMAELGRQLAALHRSGAPSFGAPWRGYLGTLDLDNTPDDSWPGFYAEQRVRPYLRLAADRGGLAPSDVRAVERVLDRLESLAGPTEPPARLHGDLWAGNVVPSRDGQTYLVDPAAHGGHRETDLAMLQLFGAPYLADLLAAYQEAWPLPDGWLDRVALHQLQPLLVHAALFGGSYGGQAGAAARRYG